MCEILEKNSRRFGYVSVIGETNAGKSSLLNLLVGSKVSIVSRKVQTTQKKILGIAMFGESQVALLDTPGFFKQRSVDNLERSAWNAFRESELVLFLVDVSRRNFSKSESLLSKIDGAKKIVLILNKIDLIHKPDLLAIVHRFSQIREYERVFMISCLNQSGIGDLSLYLQTAMPVGEWEFDQSETINQSTGDYLSEITREHVLHRVHHEIPYNCVVETIAVQDQTDGSIEIAQDILVQKEGYKKILIGARGSKIRAIRIASETEMSALLERKVSLILHVKVMKKHVER